MQCFVTRATCAWCQFAAASRRSWRLGIDLEGPLPVKGHELPREMSVRTQGVGGDGESVYILGLLGTDCVHDGGKMGGVGLS